MYNVAIFTNSIRFCETVCQFREILVKVIYYEQKKLTCEDLNKIKDIKFIGILDKQDLCNKFNKSEQEVDICLMYDFGVIIPGDMTSQKKIFNFHLGSLQNNRGSSPINWAILLGWEKTEISLFFLYLMT